MNYSAGQPAAIALVTLELTAPIALVTLAAHPSIASPLSLPSCTDDDHEVGQLEPAGNRVEPKSAGDNQGVLNRTVFTNTAVLNKHASNFESIAEVERLMGVRSK